MILTISSIVMKVIGALPALVRFLVDSGFIPDFRTAVPSSKRRIAGLTAEGIEKEDCAMQFRFAHKHIHVVDLPKSIQSYEDASGIKVVRTSDLDGYWIAIIPETK